MNKINHSFPTNLVLEQQIISSRNRVLLFLEEIMKSGLIKAGAETRNIQKIIYNLVVQRFELLGIKPQFWHKQIFRVDQDTINPYRVKVKNNIIKQGDIIFFDIGIALPYHEDCSVSIEVDLGRTIIVPTANFDSEKFRILSDCRCLFLESKAYYLQNQQTTGKELYEYVQYKAEEKGWKLSSQSHSGHLIGIFPHEKLLGDTKFNYICPENMRAMSEPDKFGNKRYWILEIHLVHPKNLFGAFYEDLLNL